MKLALNKFNKSTMDFSIVCGLSYFLLYLNVSNMDGNPFLNYLYQGLAEIPAYPIGKFATNYIGRKYTGVASFLLAFCATLPLLYTSTGKLFFLNHNY